MSLKYQRSQPLFKKFATSRMAKDVLYAKMVAYDDKVRKVLEVLIHDMKQDERIPAKDRIEAIRYLRECDKIVIDCAHKLAPFQTPKLNAMDLNTKTETRYVVVAPTQSKSKDDWMKSSGAVMHKKDNTLEQVINKPVPSIHDFDTDDEDIADQRASLMN